MKNTVATAFHRRAMEPLLSFARLSLSSLNTTRPTPIDVWLPAAISPLHYFLPGIVMQRKKLRSQLKPMQRFAQRCARSANGNASISADLRAGSGTAGGRADTV